MKENIDKTIMQSDNPISIIKQPNIDSLILEQQQMDSALDSLYDFSNSEDDGFEEEFSDQLHEKIRAKLKDANMQFEADETPIESDRVRHVTFRDKLVDVVSCSPLDSPDFSEDEDINEKSLEEIQTASQRPSSDSFKGEDNIYDFENEFVPLYCENSKLEDISEDNELILESNMEKTVTDDEQAASSDKQADTNEKAEIDDGQVITDYEEDASNDIQAEIDDKPVITKSEEEDKESDFNGSDNEYESNDFELDDVDEEKKSELDEDNENENKHDDEIEPIDDDDENDLSGNEEENLYNVQDDEYKSQLKYNTEITKDIELGNSSDKTDSSECKSDDDDDDDDEDKQKNTNTQLESAQFSEGCERDDDNEDVQEDTIENIKEEITELKENNEIETKTIIDKIKLDDVNEIIKHSKLFSENIVKYDDLDDIPKKEVDDAIENLIQSTEENTHEINKEACTSNFSVLEQQIVIDNEIFQNKTFESNPSITVKYNTNKNDGQNKSLRKTEDMLNLKRYEPSMNSTPVFTNLKETNSASSVTPKRKSSSKIKQLTMQKATKKLPNYRGNPRSQYGLSKEELQELKNKMRQKSLQKKMEEMKIEQDKLQRKQESQQAFEAWLSKKKVTDKTKNLNKNKVTNDQPEPKRNSKESDEAFQNWLEKKEEQLYIDKIISQFQKEEASLDQRKRSDANKAFKKWLRRKHREQNKTRTSSRPLDYSNSLPLSSRHLEMFAQKFYAYLGNNM